MKDELTEFEVLTALYGIFQNTMIDENMLDDTARPKKLTKKSDENDYDTVALYSWLSSKMKGHSRQKINDTVGVFNNKVKNLHDNYWLNNYLMGLFILEAWVDNNEDKFTQGILKPKITRSIRHISKGVVRAKINKEGGDAIIKESSMCASNIYRMMTGQAELTKEVREKRINQWREASRKKTYKDD